MEVSVEALFEAALSLPEDQRRQLLVRLVDSIRPDGVMSDDDPGFHAELILRINDGSEAIPWSEVRGRIEGDA
jgi:hypothetical protein